MRTLHYDMSVQYTVIQHCPYAYIVSTVHSMHWTCIRKARAPNVLRHRIDYVSIRRFSISVFCKCSKFCGEQEVSPAYLAIYFAILWTFLSISMSYYTSEHISSAGAYSFDKFVAKLVIFFIATAVSLTIWTPRACFINNTSIPSKGAQTKAFQRNLSPFLAYLFHRQPLYKKFFSLLMICMRACVIK